MAISATADMSIKLTVGASTVTITPGSISLMSGTINIVGTSGVNIVGASVNVAAMLNTPLLNAGALNAGAATVGGRPV